MLKKVIMLNSLQKIIFIATLWIVPVATAQESPIRNFQSHNNNEFVQDFVKIERISASLQQIINNTTMTPSNQKELILQLKQLLSTATPTQQSQIIQKLIAANPTAKTLLEQIFKDLNTSTFWHKALPYIVAGGICALIIITIVIITIIWYKKCEDKQRKQQKPEKIIEPNKEDNKQENPKNEKEEHRNIEKPQKKEIHEDTKISIVENEKEKKLKEEAAQRAQVYQKNLIKELEKTKENNDDIINFIQKYSPPLEIAKEIELYFLKKQNERIDKTDKNFIIETINKDGSIYHKRRQLERIYYMNRLKNYIDKTTNNDGKKFCDVFDVPKKYAYRNDLYFPPKEKDDIFDGFHVFAETVNGTLPDKITQEEVVNLVQLIEATGFSDFARDGDYKKANIMRDKKTKKLIFFDTEKKSFGGRQNDFLRSSYIESFAKVFEPLIDSKSKNWLEKRIKKLKEEEDTKKKFIERKVPNIQILPEYDDKDIDICKITVLNQSSEQF